MSEYTAEDLEDAKRNLARYANELATPPAATTSTSCWGS